MSVRRRLRRIKRLAYLGAFTGTVIAVRRSYLRRAATPHVGQPATWPPLQVAPEPPVAALGDLATADAGPVGGPPPPPPSAAAPPPSPASAATTAAWVPPVDGACPLTHPVKANGSSRIYHVPGGRFYDRTSPERCYVDAAAAELDGYRAAKAGGGS